MEQEGVPEQGNLAQEPREREVAQMSNIPLLKESIQERVPEWANLAQEPPEREAPQSSTEQPDAAQSSPRQQILKHGSKY